MRATSLESGNMKALVTGIAGFIGSNLGDALCAAGWEVRGLDSLSTGRRENMGRMGSSVEFIEGDIRNRALCEGVCKGIDVVFHLAALPSVLRSIEHPRDTYEANVLGTLHILEGARRGGVRRVVFSSSSSVYGDSKETVKSESLPANPLSPYAVSKLAGEQLCRSYTESFGLDTVALRFFNVYGPRQDPRSAYAAVIPIFFSRGLAGLSLPIYGDGRQTRDFTYVGDVVRGILAAAEAGGVSGSVFNLAGGSPVSVLDLATRVGKVLGITPRLEFRPSRPGEVLHSCADPRLCHGRLRFQISALVDEGLTRTLEWFQSVNPR